MPDNNARRRRCKMRSMIQKCASGVPVRKRTRYGMFDDIDRLFNDVFTGVGVVPLRGQATVAAFHPKVNVSENEKEIKVSAEIPGVDEKDIKVDLDESVLTIQGEKKDEHEEEGDNWYRVERSSGSFQRVIPLPSDVDGEKTKATFKKGVLTIKLPKIQEENKKTSIEVAAE